MEKSTADVRFSERGTVETPYKESARRTLRSCNLNAVSASKCDEL